MSRLYRIAAALPILAMATSAHAEWREASTDHFLVYADAGEKWTRDFAERLERSASAMEILRPDADRSAIKANRVVIYAVSGTDAVQKLCGKCGSVAGFYVPRVGNSVAYSARTTGSDSWDITSDIVLLHEYAHHFLLSSSTAVSPKWYSEGMAEFLSTMRPLADGSVEIGRPAKHRAHNIVNASMKIEQLLDSTGRADSLSQDIFYGRAWMLTHMLTFDAKRRGQLNRYLTALNTGKPNLDAAQEAFGDLGKLQKDLNAYVSKPLTFVRLPPDRVKAGSVTVRTLTPGEAAMMPVRLRSDRGVSRAQAQALVPEARRRAAAFAGDSGAQTVLAEAEYDAGNDAEAEVAADRALASDPKNVEALLYKGRVLVRRAHAAKAGPAVWKEARSWYLKANRIDANAAEPLLLFHQSFRAADVKPTDNAAQGLYRALELSPQDPGLRMTVAYQYLTDRKVDEARRTLLPLAYDPHVAVDRNFAARIVAMIDAKASIEDLLKGKPSETEAEADADAEAGDR